MLVKAGYIWCKSDIITLLWPQQCVCHVGRSNIIQFEKKRKNSENGVQVIHYT